MSENKYIYVAGHSRSGNTWLLRLLSYALNAPIKRLASADQDDIRWLRGGRGDWVVVKIKLHIDDAITAFGPNPIVAIIRDPRDVVVSRIYIREEVKGTDTEKLVHLIDELHVSPSPDHHGGRGLNYIDTIHRWRRLDIPIIDFADLKNNGPSTLAYVIEQMTGELISGEDARAAFDFVSFDRSKQTDPFFVRKGIVSDWKNHFTKPAGERITSVMGEYMIEAGYIQDLDWWKEL